MAYGTEEFVHYLKLFENVIKYERFLHVIFSTSSLKASKQKERKLCSTS